ncbi:MAG: hypothetical protein HN348_35150, partial [Proteobacteria bacterium]|nr:hypothetical protein [Pseudomonadota bacterium]
PEHMAPEQARDARHADQRSDIFSLGCIFYQMLCGRSPFVGQDSLAVMNAAATGQYPEPTSIRPDIPTHFVEVIHGCLVPNPDGRFATCAEILAVLDGEGPTLVDSPGSHMAVRATWEDGEEESTAPAAKKGRSATANALVVDQTGQGHVVEVVVVLEQGKGEVRTQKNVDRDAEVAGQVAVVAALGKASGQWSVRWAVRGVGFPLHGTSAGLAIAVATKAALHNCALPTGWAFSGGVDLDGRVASVKGLPAKLRAATEAGKEAVGVPAVDAPGLGSPPNMEVIAVGQLGDLWPRLGIYEKGRRRRYFRWLALILPPLVAFVDLSSPVDALLQYPVLKLTRGAIEAENTVVVGVRPRADLRDLRREHPMVITKLVAAGATAIFID